MFFIPLERDVGAAVIRKSASQKQKLKRSSEHAGDLQHTLQRIEAAVSIWERRGGKRRREKTRRIHNNMKQSTRFGIAIVHAAC